MPLGGTILRFNCSISCSIDSVKQFRKIVRIRLHGMHGNWDYTAALLDSANDSVIIKMSPVLVFVPQAPSGAGVPAAGDVFYNGKGMGPWRGMISLPRR